MLSLIERENDIFGSVVVSDEGGNEGVSGIDRVSDGAWGNEVDSIGLLLLDNVLRTGDKMSRQFCLGVSYDRVPKDADS